MPPMGSPGSIMEKGQLAPVGVGQGSGLPTTTTCKQKIIHEESGNDRTTGELGSKNKQDGKQAG